MARLFTRCPVTGHALDTGIEIEPDSFERLPSLIAKVFCPYCQIEHGWTKEMAWPEDGPKPKS